MLAVFRDFELFGPSEKLKQFVSELGKSLPANWKRDHAREEQVKRHSDSGNRFAYHIAATDDRPAAHLFLWDNGNTYTISNVVPERFGQLTRAEYNAFVDEFLAVSTPIAEHLGLTIRATKAFLDISETLTPRATKALQTFESLANVSSLHPLDRERWRTFLILAHQDRVSLSEELLFRWLVEEQRWPEDSASKLSDEYGSALELLRDYDESKT